jgi:hypothetical protein
MYIKSMVAFGLLMASYGWLALGEWLLKKLKKRTAYRSCSLVNIALSTAQVCNVYASEPRDFVDISFCNAPEVQGADSYGTSEPFNTAIARHAWLAQTNWPDWRELHNQASQATLKPLRHLRPLRVPSFPGSYGLAAVANLSNFR